MSKIGTNFIYNIFLTLSNYIISLVVFPYVSRSLGVDIIGRLGFVDNTIAYFSLFALLGVTSVGIREIASCGIDRKKRSEVFSSIFSLILITTVVSLILYGIAIAIVPRLAENRELFFIGSFQLVFLSMLIEWLYQGLENFKYITIRGIIVRIIYVILIFVFIKSPNDYLLYYGLTVSVTVMNAIINLLYARNFVDFSFKHASPFKYFKQILSLGFYRITTSMYTTFNVVFLGFVCSETEVGYYSTSTKIFYIILGVLSAFTGVMLPRMSSLIAQGKLEEFKSKIQDSFDLVLAVSVPLIAGGTLLAPNIIKLLAGENYDGAIMPMQIIMPMIIITGFAQICVIQVLLPMRKDKVILISACIGALTGICSNFLLAPKYGAIGSALTLLISEIVGDSISFTYAILNRYITINIRKQLIYVSKCAPYIVFILCSIFIFQSLILQLLTSILLCGLYFAILNIFLLNNSLISRYVKSIINKL